MIGAVELAPLAFPIDWVAILQVVIAFVLPLLVGIVTKKTTNSTVKVVLLGGLSLVSSFLTQWLAASIAGTAYDGQQALLTGLVSWGISIASHLGVWVPTGATSKAQEFGTARDGTPSVTTLPEEPTDRVPGPDHRA